jgi:tetratricopeptide (TPR) repeat protein
MYKQVLAGDAACAEAVHFLGIAAMHKGKLEEALKLIRQSIELEPRQSDYFNNMATVLGRMNKAIEALGAAQQAIDLKADFAEAYGNKGVALEQLGRLDEAIEAYRKAAELRPDHADALANLGNALSRKGQHEEAITCLRKFVQLRPKVPDARKLLGNALRRAHRPTEAVVAYRMAVEMNPKDPDAYNNLGAALQESGRVIEAEQMLRTCLSIKPDHTDAHWNRGLALLAMGRWREGWMEYEWRQHLKEDVGQKRTFPQPIWKGSPLEGRTLLVLCEQGLGDTIQFIRYVPMLVERGAKVILECQSRLKPLLERMTAMRQGDGQDTGPVKVVAKGEPLPNFDMHARLLTLPGIMDSMPESLPNQVPYFQIEEPRVRRCRQVLQKAIEAKLPTDAEQANKPFLVGLVWQGNAAHKGDFARSIALERLAPLAQVPGVCLVSLQKGFGCEQIEKCKETVPVIEWADSTDMTADALVDTAALMQSLDLVIAVDTAVAHLAGAMGIPVWVAMPVACDWRWLLVREDTPWYPTMRLFRQEELGDWDNVIARMQVALEEKVDGKPTAALPARQILIPVSPGELYDRLTFLEVDHATANGSSTVGDELQRLFAVASRLELSAQAQELVRELRKVHQALTQTDHDIAQHVSESDFGARFIEAVQALRRLQDQRRQIKSGIDDAAASASPA